MSDFTASCVDWKNNGPLNHADLPNVDRHHYPELEVPLVHLYYLRKHFIIECLSNPQQQIRPFQVYAFHLKACILSSMKNTARCVCVCVKWQTSFDWKKKKTAKYQIWISTLSGCSSREKWCSGKTDRTAHTPAALVSSRTPAPFRQHQQRMRTVVPRYCVIKPVFQSCFR